MLLVWLVGTFHGVLDVLAIDGPDDRWEGGIDRHGVVKCELTNKGGKCQSKSNCVFNLTAKQERFCMKDTMEPAYLGTHIGQVASGFYTCACCNSSLFHSSKKIDTASGYATFIAPIEHGAVGYKHHEGSWLHHPLDTGIHCEYCGSHLGNVREDGPPPHGRRYIVNSACIKFFCDLPKCARDEDEYFRSKQVRNLVSSP
eukprot:752546-Hanusia_phi.AAC.1